MNAERRTQAILTTTNCVNHMTGYHNSTRIQESRIDLIVDVVTLAEKCLNRKKEINIMPPRKGANTAKRNTKRVRKAGRPSVYSKALGDEICRRLADGESLRSICQGSHMPTESAVRAWSNNPDHPIYAQYARAREIQAWTIADEILEIADDASNDFIETENGRIVDHENIARSRLRVDTRKWMLSKMLPKHFGDKVSTEIGGPDGGPIKTEVVFSIVDGEA